MTKKDPTLTQNKSVRPTKKQHELLEFLREFIAQHGYSPSYREIMRGCNYSSVATVALHVSNLIKRGHIVKRSNSARSLEVVKGVVEKSSAIATHKHELVNEIEGRFKKLEKDFSDELLSELYVLVGALKILGHVDASRAYAGHITEMKR